MHNPIQPDTTPDDSENRRETVEKTGSTSRRFPKDHVNFWRSRLRRQGYGSKKDGTYKETATFTVRIHHLGRSHAFTFKSLNETACATQARNIYRDILCNGWDAVLKKRRPQSVQSVTDNPTIGDLLSEVSLKSGLRGRTFRNYANCFRTIVAGVFDIKDDGSKYDYRSGGTAGWQKKIDSVKLKSLTPDKIQKWKVQFIKKAGDSPAAQQSARRTVNSYIRCSRSLFSTKNTKFVTIKLPEPLPFAGVQLEKSGSMRYQSNIDASGLILSAQAELKLSHPEPYKIFLLSLFAGLRRAEIDGLEWKAIDFQTHKIRVDFTDVTHVKADGSAASVDVDSEFLDELQSLKGAAESRFVVHSHRPPCPGLDRPYYRCQAHFEFLSQWLKAKGITANKPIHELRKELGAIVASKHGIFAASHILRHSDIATTARHYADQKTRISAGLGQLLGPGKRSEENPPPSKVRVGSKAVTTSEEKEVPPVRAPLMRTG